MFSLLEQLVQLARERGREVWLVGGFVRDLLLGRAGRDVDAAVSGRGAELARELAARTGGAFVPLDAAHDVSRVVCKTGEGVRQLDITGLGEAALRADLCRRDFTVNAMALPLAVCMRLPGMKAVLAGADAAGPGAVSAGDLPAADLLIDPLGGLADLRRGLIRACGPRSIADDPLRALRAARFAGRFGWRIEADTARSIRTASLAGVAAERMQEELVLILMLPHAHRVMRMLDEELGVLEQLFPEIAPMRRMEQNGHHVDNVWEHCLKTLQCFEALLRESCGPDGSPGRGWNDFDAGSGEAGSGVPQISVREGNPAGTLRPGAPEDPGRFEPGRCGGLRGGRPEQTAHSAGAAPGPPARGEMGAGGKPFPPPGLTLPPAAAAPLAAYLEAPFTRARSRLPVLKLACLFHDVGKLTTRAMAADGRFTFYGHHTAGAPVAASVARRLRLSRREEELLAALVRGHMDPLFLYKSRPVSGRAAYRFFRRLGDEVPGCLLLSLADIASSRLAAGAAAEAADYRDFIAGMLARYFKEPALSGRTRPLLDGREICRLLGIPPSPSVGRLLEELAAARAAGEVRNRQEAAEWLRIRHGWGRPGQE